MRFRSDPTYQHTRSLEVVRSFPSPSPRLKRAQFGAQSFCLPSAPERSVHVFKPQREALFT